MLKAARYDTATIAATSFPKGNTAGARANGMRPTLIPKARPISKRTDVLLTESVSMIPITAPAVTEAKSHASKMRIINDPSFAGKGV
jgi:hypothetical protein